MQYEKKQDANCRAVCKASASLLFVKQQIKATSHAIMTTIKKVSYFGTLPKLYSLTYVVLVSVNYLSTPQLNDRK